MMSLYGKGETMTINSCQAPCGLLCLEVDILSAVEKHMVAFFTPDVIRGKIQHAVATGLFETLKLNYLQSYLALECVISSYLTEMAPSPAHMRHMTIQNIVSQIYELLHTSVNATRSSRPQRE